MAAPANSTGVKAHEVPGARMSGPNSFFYASLYGVSLQMAMFSAMPRLGASSECLRGPPRRAQQYAVPPESTDCAFTYLMRATGQFHEGLGDAFVSAITRLTFLQFIQPSAIPSEFPARPDSPVTDAARLRLSRVRSFVPSDYSLSLAAASILRARDFEDRWPFPRKDSPAPR